MSTPLAVIFNPVVHNVIIARLFQVEFFVLSADLSDFFKATAPKG